MPTFPSFGASCIGRIDPLRFTTSSTGLFPWIIFTTSSVVMGEVLLIETSKSPSWIPAISAMLPVKGEKTIPLWEIYPIASASEKEGRITECVGASEKGITLIGVIPFQKSPVKITNAKRKFMVTHAISTRILAGSHFVIKAHFPEASSPVGSSPKIRTKPPIGRRFIV